MSWTLSREEQVSEMAFALFFGMSLFLKVTMMMIH
jgi:hypothetical protein